MYRLAWAAVGIILLSSSTASASIKGAIFTTLVDGTRVNANIYEDKDDVYLDGGPGPNAPATAAGLPDGDYYFQVTDPSGKTLLSQDAVKCRKIRVEGGVIVEVYAATKMKKVKGQWVEVDCTHQTGIDIDQGALTVQLMPYANTPNNGGVYKVWITPVDQFVGDPEQVDNPRYFHGFVPAFSKTDNYKVIKKGKPVDPSMLIVDSYGDCDIDCTFNGDDALISGWPIEVTDPNNVTNIYYTPVNIYTALAGTYTITQVATPSTFVTSSELNGTLDSCYPTGSNVVQFTVQDEATETNSVLFGNSVTFETEVTVYYDANGNGSREAAEGGVANSQVSLAGTDITGATVGPVVQLTDANGQTVYTDLIIGDYTVDFVGIPSAPIEDEWCLVSATNCEFSVRYCLDTPFPQPIIVTCEIGLTCTDTVAFGTKGYWHNKNGLAEMSQDDIDYANTLWMFDSASPYFEDGDEPFDGYFADGVTPVAAAFNNENFEVAQEGTPKAEVSQFLVDSNGGGNPREQLAQQFLAFVMNARNRAGGIGGAIVLSNGNLTPISDLVADAQLTWLEGSSEDQNALKTLFDTLNNSATVEVTLSQPSYTCGE